MAAATDDSLDAGQPFDESSRSPKKAQSPQAKEGIKQKWSREWYKEEGHTELIFHATSNPEAQNRQNAWGNIGSDGVSYTTK